MKLLVAFILTLNCYISQGQFSHYQNLLDSSFLGYGALFVHKKPINKIELDKKEMWAYFSLYRDYAKKNLDTIMFAQIIQNSKSLDTTDWHDNELTKFILVSGREENISLTKALEKLQPRNSKQKKLYRQQINKYNSTEPYNRDLVHFSRLVFDNSKNYAIVQWYNGNSGGGGGINLYQLEGEVWIKLGSILNWRY